MLENAWRRFQGEVSGNRVRVCVCECPCVCVRVRACVRASVCVTRWFADLCVWEIALSLSLSLSQILYLCAVVLARGLLVQSWHGEGIGGDRRGGRIEGDSPWQ